MKKLLLLVLFGLFTGSCRNTEQTEIAVPDRGSAEDSLKANEPDIARDTIEFSSILQAYLRALPDVGDTAVWGTWEEFQGAPRYRLKWENLPADLAISGLSDSSGLPSPQHFRSSPDDSAFYLPTAEAWVRCNSSSEDQSEHNYYFYQGFIKGLGTYFFPGCSTGIGGTCDYYLLDSISGNVRVVRCEFDSPYRYVAWSEADSLLMLIANDGFSSSGVSAKVLRVFTEEGRTMFDHVLMEQFMDVTVTGLRVLPAGGFAVELADADESGTREERYWQRLRVLGDGDER